MKEVNFHENYSKISKNQAKKSKNDYFSLKLLKKIIKYKKVLRFLCRFLTFCEKIGFSLKMTVFVIFS